MRRIIREFILWALSIVFAGIMLIGAVAEISIGTWYEGLVKIVLFLIGFVGLYWASNKTSFGRRICGDSFER